MRQTKRAALAALVVAALGGAGCREAESRPVELPRPDSVAAWFGGDTEARLDGRVLELRGTLAPEMLRRGGSLWARSSPYYYLFNVQVRELVVRYPELAGVRAVVAAPDGREIARATLPAGTLNRYEWQRALALASLAQREGTENLRRVEELIEWGEEVTQYEYADG